MSTTPIAAALFQLQQLDLELERLNAEQQAIANSLKGNARLQKLRTEHQVAQQQLQSGLQSQDEAEWTLHLVHDPVTGVHALGARDALELEGTSVGELLERLTGEHATLRPHLFADDGRLRSFVNVYVNDEDIRYLAKENTPTKDGDTISIIPSIAGGVTFSGAVAVPGGAALNFARNLWSLIVPPRRIGI